jgi:DNA-binding MarR family transcriptional regulator
MRAIDIAANGHMSTQAVKPLIDPLEARGYLERVPDLQDHRAQRIHTIPRGKQLLAAAIARCETVLRELARVGTSRGVTLRRDARR